MSIALTVAPLKYLNDTGEQSKWSAGNRQPVIWKFLRRDCEITAFNYNSGSPAGLEITVTGDFTSEVNVGDTVYVNGSNGDVEGSYEVLDVQLSGGDTIITIDFADITTYANNGYLNLIQGRTFYRIEIAIYGYVSGIKKIINSNNYSIYRPDTQGIIKADIGDFIRTTLSMTQSTFDYASRTKAEPCFGSRYDIETREYWKEQTSEQAFITATGYDEHYIVNSVRQVGQVYGNNMAEFVMYPTNQDSPQTEHSKGKFLTMFEMPKYFPGYPFSLGFIYDKAIQTAGQRLSIVEDQLNINGGSVTLTDDLIDELPEVVNHAVLRGVWDAPSAYASNIAKLLFYLKAVELGNQVDAYMTYNVALNFQSNVQIKDITNSVTIGNAQWSVDLATLLADLATSINTNTQDGPLIDPSYPFDNSAGYTCVITPTGGGYYDVVITSPTGSGAGYNGTDMQFQFDAGQWFITPTNPLFDNYMANGDDGGYVDVPGLTTARVSEEKYIEVEQECKDNQIFLRWMNPSGYYDQWAFDFNYLVRDTTSNEETFEVYVEDVGDSTGRKQVMRKDVQEEILLRSEQLSTQQCEGLRYLLSSIHVQRYIPNGTGFVWETCRIKTSTFDIQEARENKGFIEITLLPSERYNQQQ